MFQPDFTDAIFFFEEVGEEPYRIDRMLTQLKLAGILRSIRALLIGSLVKCVPADKAKPSLSLDEVLDELTWDLKIPILSTLAYGHVPRKLTMPIGPTARVDSRLGTLELLEACVK
jgi:muramoyltetrapeptide carboxypeptidase